MAAAIQPLITHYANRTIPWVNIYSRNDWIGGRVVGIVTSCSIDSEGFQTGQAYLKEEFAEEGTPVLVFSGAARAKNGKALDSLAAEIFTSQAMASAYGIPKCVARKDLAIAR